MELVLKKEPDTKKCLHTTLRNLKDIQKETTKTKRS